MRLFTFLKKKALPLSIVLLFPIASFCQTNTWIGGNANWNVAGNWTLGVPTAAHDVVINTSSTITVNLSTITINTLTINTSASVTFVCGAQDATIIIQEVQLLWEAPLRYRELMDREQDQWV
jgi:hypothetical protein